MNREELEAVREVQVDPTRINVTDILSGDRTLMYGYNTGTYATFHVYLKDGELHRAIYHAGHPGSPADLHDHIQGTSLEASLLRPNKRAYPERTDAEFAIAMIRAGHPLTFTTFDDDALAKVKGNPFYGLTF